MTTKQTFKTLVCAFVALNTCVPAAAWSTCRYTRHYYAPVTYVPTYVPVSTVTVVEPDPIGCVLGAAAVGTVLGLGIGCAIDSSQRRKEERRREEVREDERALERRRQANRRYESELRYEEQLRAEDNLAMQNREITLRAQLQEQEQAHQKQLEEIRSHAQGTQTPGVMSRFFSWIGSWFTWLW